MQIHKADIGNGVQLMRQIEKKVHVYKDKWPIELNGLLRRNDLTLITLVQHFSVKLVGQSLFALSQRKCPLKQCDLHSAMNICFP